MNENFQEILKIEQLCKSFGGLNAVKNLNMEIKKNEIHGLIGPNGAGKTTTLNLITGLINPDSGKILFNNENIIGLTPFIIASKGISRTFQLGKLIPDMTVLENVMLGKYITSKKAFLNTFLHIPFTKMKQEESVRDSSLKLLEDIDMKDYANRLAEELVWVERQFVQIIRAISSNPKILLLDEPTAGMGIEESKEIEFIIKKIRSNFGISVLLVSHDVRLITNVVDVVTCINFGEVIWLGLPNKIIEAKPVLEAYIGKEYDFGN